TQLHEGLQMVLQRYATARSSEPFGKQHALWQTFERLMGDLERSVAVAKRPNLKVTWSMGAGNWAKVPWIAFLDSRETSTTQRGVYCVYLFRQDMTGVYLTFNQGVTEPKKTLGAVKAREALRQNARALRAHCRPLIERGFQLDEGIDLHADP